MKKKTFRIFGLVLGFILIFNLLVFAEDTGEICVVNDLGDVKIVAEKYYNYYRGNKFAMYKNYGVIDKDGNIIVEQKYLGILPPRDGRAAFAIDWKIGFFDENWDVCIEPKYYLNQIPFSDLYFSEGLAAVAKKDDYGNMLWGYIDRDGNEVIDFIYDGASSFENGVAEVEISEEVYNYNTKRKYAQIDKSGNIVKPFKFGYALEKDYEYLWQDPINVQLSENLVELNGRRYKNSDIEYPFINYLGYSYIPLTYYGCRMMGINCDWTEETGVVLSGGGEMAEDIIGDNGMTEGVLEKATFYRGKLTINGTTYEYGDTAYPLIHYKDVVYIPVLWQTGMEELGIDYSFIGAEKIENSDRGCMVFKTKQIPTEEKKENLDNFRTIGYYSGDLFEEPLENLQTDKLTHIMYAFLIPQEDGSVLPLSEEENVRMLIEKAHSDNCEVFIAVGGWSYNNIPLQETFEKACANPETRNALVESIVKTVEDYGFDGVELDWEYPQADSQKNYEALILALDSELEARGKQLTAALNGAWSATEGPEVSKYVSDACLQAFDFINVMSYDMNNDQHSPFWFANTSIDYWLNRGVKAENIVLGMPLYARPTFMQYRHLVENNKNFAYSDYAVIDGKESHYNGLPTLCKKTVLATKKAGGVMLFDVNEDTNDETSVVSMIDETVSYIEANGYENITSVEFLENAENTDELINTIK